MIKILKLLTVVTWGSTTVSAIVYNWENNKETVPTWVNTMIENNPNQINIGYDHYSLINKKTDKTDYFQQKDWINLDKNKNLYLYLPQAKNIDEAIENIAINDSAETWTIGIKTAITWTKINNTTYTNNTFITQDTSISAIALLNNNKFNQIKNSNKWNTLTTKEQEMFINYGKLPALRETKKQDWWNANNWETLLSKAKNLISTKQEDQGKKFSQLDLYNRWINQDIIGMNVPLSLINKNSFTLKETKLNHVFLFQSMPYQLWIDNNGKITNFTTPHWGFTLKINNKGNTIFQTPQLITLDDAFKKNIITNYLDEKQYFSFNSQENDKFKNNYLIDLQNNSPVNNYLYLLIVLILSILLFITKYQQNWIKSLSYKLKNQNKEQKYEKRKKTK